jgi:cytochrome c2
MKNDTPQHQHNPDRPVACVATASHEVEPINEYSLSFYVSFPSTAIEKDTMPFSALVHVQQRVDLMAYLRSMQNNLIDVS